LNNRNSLVEPPSMLAESRVLFPIVRQIVTTGSFSFPDLEARTFPLNGAQLIPSSSLEDNGYRHEKWPLAEAPIPGKRVLRSLDN